MVGWLNAVWLYPEFDIIDYDTTYAVMYSLSYAYTLGPELTSEYSELLIPGTLWPAGTEISETM